MMSRCGQIEDELVNMESEQFLRVDEQMRWKMKVSLEEK